jgi:hypothetical protein
MCNNKHTLGKASGTGPHATVKPIETLQLCSSVRLRRQNYHGPRIAKERHALTRGELPTRRQK